MTLTNQTNIVLQTSSEYSYCPYKVSILYLFWQRNGKQLQKHTPISGTPGTQVISVHEYSTFGICRNKNNPTHDSSVEDADKEDDDTGKIDVETGN